jgi:ATP-dependent Lhr-like helicase
MPPRTDHGSVRHARPRHSTIARHSARVKTVRQAGIGQAGAIGAVPLDRRLVQVLDGRRWVSLRPLQALTCAAWRSNTNSLLVISRSGGGKTDAAWLPILDDLAAGRLGGAIGLVPFKSLLGDLADHLTRLADAVGVTILTLIDQASTRLLAPDALGRGSRVIVLTTPETLEVLLRRRPALVARLTIDAAVVDSAQTLLPDARGAQVRCLLSRLGRLRSTHLRRIVLSSTGEPESIAALVDPGHPVAVIGVPGQIRDIDLSICGYARDDDVAEVDTQRLHQDIARTVRDTTSLVFCASRTAVERVAAGVAQALQALGNATGVGIHHASVPAEYRAAAEQALRAGLPFACVTTATLEPGLDLGEVHRVVSLAAPTSVAAFTQRIGRAARQLGVLQVRLCLRGYLARADQGPEEALNVEAARTIACVRLFQRGWTEPLDARHWRLEVLAHQALSLLAEAGGRPDGSLHRQELGDALCDPGMRVAAPASAVDDCIDHLAGIGLIARGHDDRLTLTEAGQTAMRDPLSIGVFAGQVAVPVRHGDEVIGEIAPSDRLLCVRGLTVGGRPWRLLGQAGGALQVEPWTEASPPPRCDGVHPTVDPVVIRAVQRLIEPTPFDTTGLDDRAVAILQQAQRDYARLGLRYDPLQRLSGGTYLWHWQGSKAAQALAIALTVAGYDVKRGYAGIEVARIEPQALLYVLRRLAGRLEEQIRKRLTDTGLLRAVEHRHAAWVPDRLLVEQYLACDLDIPAAEQWLAPVVARR